MSVLLGYMSRLFAARFALIFGGLVMLVLLLDVMAQSNEIIAGEEGVMGLWRYGGLRLPLIASRLIPFSVLIAALLTLIYLSRHGELVVMTGAGVSQFKLIAMFLPVVLIIAGGHFWIDDRAGPASIRALDAWGVAGYAPARPSGGGRGGGTVLWVRAGNDIIRLRQDGGIDADDHNRLGALSIFSRDAAGNLIERLDAASAVNDSGVWTLYDVTRFDVAANRLSQAAEMAWPGDLLPSQISTLSSHPRALPLSAVWRFVRAPGYGSRPHYVYKTWLNRKLAAPLASLMMILIAVPLTQRFQRHGGAAATLALGVAIGFCFFVFDGFTLAVGESGLLPPWIAAWAPTLVFSAIGAGLGFHWERR